MGVLEIDTEPPPFDDTPNAVEFWTSAAVHLWVWSGTSALVTAGDRVHRDNTVGFLLASISLLFSCDDRFGTVCAKRWGTGPATNNRGILIDCIGRLARCRDGRCGPNTTGKEIRGT